MSEQPSPSTGKVVSSCDVVVVGAGIGGLYALHRLRSLGLDVQVFEAGDGVGGTWYWNRYPGARCDVESLFYSYSFSAELEQEWEWTERYPTQREILSYLNHVADRFELRRDIRLETRVTAAVYDEAARRWSVTTDRGDQVMAQFVVMATGCLSTWQIPAFPGVDSFQGERYHTGNWPHDPVDFAGKRVGFIGTGSTGIQAIPQIAKTARQLTVFQRTPNYAIPARNAPLRPGDQREVKARYREIRERMRTSPSGLPFAVAERAVLEEPPDLYLEALEEAWQAGGPPFLMMYRDVAVAEDANAIVADFVRSKIRETVRDPATAELLCPIDHPIGSKRICIEIEYFETYNRDNVELVDVRHSPVEEITPTGLRTSERTYELDVLVFATGFDAMTGTLLRIDIRGRGGVPLRERWADGPRTYLGLQVAGFPNLFTITGPGSPSVLSNMVVSIEQHVDWIADCITDLRAANLDTIEALPEAETIWVEHVNEVGAMTLYPKANSWYLGANIPGKPRIFMPYVGGVGVYRQYCDEVREAGYQGFVRSSPAGPADAPSPRAFATVTRYSKASAT